MLGSQLDASSAAAPKDKAHSAHFSTGQVAQSFTSTHIARHTVNVAASIDDDQVRYAAIKVGPRHSAPPASPSKANECGAAQAKGYVRLITSHGALNLELRCDVAPRTCENFLKHCAAGYYVDTEFHRSIRNFMIQGGDPTGTGKGGESVRPPPQPPFPHVGRGRPARRQRRLKVARRSRMSCPRRPRRGCRTAGAGC